MAALHSVHEKNELLDSQIKINKRSSTDKQYHSNNKDEEHTLTDDNIIDQNNDSEISSDTVADYIFLVNSKEFTVDVKTKNENSNVLNEYELEKYLDFITKLTRDHKLSFINKDYIEIHTIDSCKVTVKADNFNGFDLKDDGLNCKLCMVVVEDPAYHVYDIEHIANVWHPLEDKHCFRKINKVLQHCVHCNETFNDLHFHKLLESHTFALKAAMDRSFPSKPINPKTSMIYCEQCKMYTDSKSNVHKNSRQHKRNVKLLKTKKKKTFKPGPSGKTYCNKNKNETVTQNVDAHSYLNEETNYNRDIDNPKPNDECEIHCEPCNLKMSKDKFPEHLCDKNHNEQLKLTNKCEGLHKEICTICNIYTDLSNHVSGAYHEYHVKNMENSEAPIPLNQASETDISYQIKTEQLTKVICKICTKRFTIDPGNISGHTHGRIHRSNYNGLIDVNLLKIVNNKFLCEICEMTVEPTEELKHIQSKTHKSALMQFNSGKTFCDKCKTYVLTANRSTHLTGDYHKFNVQQSNAPRNKTNFQTPFSLTSAIDTEYQITVVKWTEMICKVCNCKLGKFPIITGDSDGHMKGRSHVRNYNELLFKNNIEKVNDRLYCAACKISVELSKELEHIDAKTHKSALTQYKTDNFNVPFNQEPENAFLNQEHENAFFTLAKGLIENSLLVTQVADSVTCRLCNVNVLLELSKEHLRLPAHNTNYRTTLDKNRVQRVNNKYFCGICSVDVSDREVIKHLRSLTHLFERQLALPNSQTNSSNCAVCDVPRK